jgi:hypothetical protein
MSDNNTNTINNTLDDDELSQRPNGKLIAEARAQAEIEDLIYEQARLKIRAKGGLMSTMDAVETVLKEDIDIIKQKLLALTASEDLDFYLRFKANPEKALAYLDATIAEMESPD